MGDENDLIKEPVASGEEDVKADEERRKLLHNILQGTTSRGGNFPDACLD